MRLANESGLNQICYLVFEFLFEVWKGNECELDLMVEVRIMTVLNIVQLSLVVLDKCPPSLFIRCQIWAWPDGLWLEMVEIAWECCPWTGYTCITLHKHHHSWLCLWLSYCGSGWKEQMCLKLSLGQVLWRNLEPMRNAWLSSDKIVMLQAMLVGWMCLLWWRWPSQSPVMISGV